MFEALNGAIGRETCARVNHRWTTEVTAAQLRASFTLKRASFSLAFSLSFWPKAAAAVARQLSAPTSKNWRRRQKCRDNHTVAGLSWQAYHCGSSSRWSKFKSKRQRLSPDWLEIRMPLLLSLSLPGFAAPRRILPPLSTLRFGRQFICSSWTVADFILFLQFTQNEPFYHHTRAFNRANCKIYSNSEKNIFGCDFASFTV